MSKILITGGAGFIGSHLVDKLIKKDNEVIVLDNLSSWKKEFIQHHFDNLNFKFYRVDLLTNKIYKYFKNVDEVWHLAVNADVRSALKDIKVDIKQNIIVTYRVLEAMRKSNVKKLSLLHLQQSMAKLKKIPTPEDYPCKPISLY